MTRYSEQNATGDLGANFVERVCIEARVLYRRVVERDTGIDGLIELTDHGDATGVLVGVQIKSGESFVDDAGLVFTFKSDQDHFAYWARCAIPVIGIVYSPKHNQAVWVDLTLESTPERIRSGPYTICIEFSDAKGTSFSVQTLQSEIASQVKKWLQPRRPLGEIRPLLVSRAETSDVLVPAVAASTNRKSAWLSLIKIFLDVSAPVVDQADAGYRLSWYFPTVDSRKQKQLTDRIIRADERWLASVVRTVHWLLEEGHDRSAELVGALLLMDPLLPQKLERMLRNRSIPDEHREAAVQILELNEGEFQEELRADLGMK